MHDNNDDLLLTQVEAMRQQRRWSQLYVSECLGVSQGHLSKVLTRSVTLTARMRDMLAILVGSHPPAGSELAVLERETIAALRASPEFRAHVAFGLKMHRNA